MSIKASELILNPDGSVYHLNLKPEHIADTIIVVGDQNRVELVSRHFDTVDFKIQKREFKTHTGTLNSKRISVISTGIGTDNIDIVINELDALANIDFETRTIKQHLTSLNIIRIGTSGGLQPNIPIDSIVVSEYGLDINGLLHSYQTETISNLEMEDAFIAHTNWNSNKARPIIVKGFKSLLSKFESDVTSKGITATANGFYGPQGRVLRLQLEDAALNKKMDSFNFKGVKITNLEMETSAIYGLSHLLGHNAISLNAIIANRANGTFSKNPRKAVEDLITYTLDRI
ncbi:nucleoside phosphorylase [Jejuia pallidilutea]|uniref:Uridine phosphorylase n=1 Tax=Jejuia pallidilutea TaxID=504487 RepID=A0A090WCG5_9FLAO|nr:nucleoside phosphorylase [Jejuia pallidilutea]GAL67143.1 purine nucleoside phosphorylase [Jejuia pallidilutea]GAL73119.1 purine nucleoside phosphorylase [Jejuia pallidilutea]GAL90698.1 purine nucleoside phosphorylase [Jejuia pallidilutea]